MPQSFTIGGTEYSLRPRSLNLDLELGGDDGPRVAMRNARMENLRVQVLRENAQNRMIRLANGDKAPTKAALDAITAEIAGYDADAEAIDVREMEAMLRFVSVVVRDADGSPPPDDHLRDLDVDVVNAVLEAVAGIPPTDAAEG